MGLRATLGGLAIACAAAFACNGLTGIGDLSVGPEPDASVITTPPTDAAVDAGPKPLCPSAGNSCVPAAPAGWDGPFQIYSGDAKTVPDCPSALPRNDDENIGQPAGSINCAGCRCGTPNSQKCNVGLLEYADSACTAPAANTVDLSICQAAPDPNNPGSATTATFVTGGTCGSYVATKEPSNVTWPSVARLCSRDDDFLADGCPDGSLCVPDGVTPFFPHTCIRQEHADVACPAPWTQKTTAYNNFGDTRDCSTDGCSCDTPTGSTCTGTVRYYAASTTCTGAVTTQKTPTTTCTVGTATTSARLITGSTAITGGNCNPEGNPTPTGGVFPGNDVNTICCVP